MLLSYLAGIYESLGKLVDKSSDIEIVTQLIYKYTATGVL